MALRYVSTRGDIGSRSQSTSTCVACGENLHEITYQARSADEPPRTILLCLKCPLNPEKLSTAGPRAARDYGMGHPKPRVRLRLPNVVARCNGGRAWILSTSGVDENSISQAIAGRISATVHVTRLLCVCPDDPHPVPRPELVNLSNGTYSRTVGTWGVAPGVTLRRVITYEVVDFKDLSWVTNMRLAQDTNLDGVKVTIKTQDHGSSMLCSEGDTMNHEVLRKFVTLFTLQEQGPKV